jgi:hypothetical protein
MDVREGQAGQGREGKGREVRKIRMGGAQCDPPFDEASAAA